MRIWNQAEQALIWPLQLGHHGATRDTARCTQQISMMDNGFMKGIEIRTTTSTETPRNTGEIFFAEEKLVLFTHGTLLVYRDRSSLLTRKFSAFCAAHNLSALRSEIYMLQV